MPQLRVGHNGNTRVVNKDLCLIAERVVTGPTNALNLVRLPESSANDVAKVSPRSLLIHYPAN